MDLVPGKQSLSQGFSHITSWKKRRKVRGEDQGRKISAGEGSHRPHPMGNPAVQTRALGWCQLEARGPASWIHKSVSHWLLFGPRVRLQIGGHL